MRGNQRFRHLTIASLVILWIVALSWFLYANPEHYHSLKKLASLTPTTKTASTTTTATTTTTTPKSIPAGPKHRYAFATFLAPDKNDVSQKEDNYFTATRVLIHQLLHSPKTRTNTSIPFIVIVTENVSETKRERLREDGARVIPVEFIVTQKWIAPADMRWRDQFTKLRLFELTEFEKLLYLDSDMLVTRRLDGIFDDPADQDSETMPDKQDQSQKDQESALPTEYVMAARPDNVQFGSFEHVNPPDNREAPMLNAGFWVAKPSLEMFNYYMSIMNIPWSFDAGQMEQSLLNYAHRDDGPMPWKRLNWKWNANFPNDKDAVDGIATLHDKFWDAKNDLGRLWREAKKEMDERAF